MSQKPNGKFIYVIPCEDYLEPSSRTFRKLQIFPKQPAARQKISKLKQFIQFMQKCNLFDFLKAKKKCKMLLCQLKSEFEIYCEIASIHGFIMFVGASTKQRIFWCLVILAAIIMSAIVVHMSHINNQMTPTRFYVETLHYPIWAVPFPAVTICYMHRISKTKADKLINKFLPATNLTRKELIRLFHLPFYLMNHIDAKQHEFHQLKSLLDQQNYTLSSFVEDIIPKSKNLLVRCKWKGIIVPCNSIFQEANTTQGFCHSFNYNALSYNYFPNHIPSKNNNKPYHNPTSGYKSGLTVLINPQIEDYMATITRATGVQVLVHDTHTFPENLKRLIVPSRTQTIIKIAAETVYGTKYLKQENVNVRQCLFEGERSLFHFRNYSHNNCLAECRSLKIFQKCGCVPHFLPKNATMTICGIDHAGCVLNNSDIFDSVRDLNYKIEKGSREIIKFICDCYPECSFNIYKTTIDKTALNRTFSMGDKKFFQSIDIKDHILLHVFYGDLLSVRFRQDVIENWLSYIGNVGGILGLFMGYSLISGFELIFFVCIRPICNWLTTSGKVLS